MIHIKDHKQYDMFSPFEHLGPKTARIPVQTGLLELSKSKSGDYGTVWDTLQRELLPATARSNVSCIKRREPFLRGHLFWKVQSGHPTK